MTRTNHDSGTPWEPKVGYSRAVRVGNHVWVSGTTATDRNGEIVGVGDAATQARKIFENLDRALQAVGAEMRHVVRTQIFVKEIRRWESVGLVHGEVFGEIRPATTMVEVSGFIHPDMLVEIEAEAVVED